MSSATLCELIKSDRGLGNIVGRAPEMDKLYRLIVKAAHSVHPVLIFGRERHREGDGRACHSRIVGDC